MRHTVSYFLHDATEFVTDGDRQTRTGDAVRFSGDQYGATAVFVKVYLRYKTLLGGLGGRMNSPLPQIPTKAGLSCQVRMHVST